MGIKKFSNWLVKIQLNLIDKQEKQSILEEVKRSKFLKHLPQYMKPTMIPQIKEDSTCEILVPEAESYEVSKRHIAVPTTTTSMLRQTSNKAHNPDRNKLWNGGQHLKTGFNRSNNNPSNRLAKSYTSNNPDWDAITGNMDQKTELELIQDKKCL